MVSLLYTNMARLSPLALATCILLVLAAGYTMAEDNPYIQYIPGSLPVILSAPHDGIMRPDHVPDRDAGCWENGACIWSHTCDVKNYDRCKAVTVRDMNATLLTLELRDQLFLLTGQYPHVIICDLSRVKLDANRALYEAAFRVPEMEEAWTEYHRHIYQAKAAVGTGLYVDMHGHGHDQQWAELGYLISGHDLDAGTMDAPASSIRSVVASSGLDFDDVLRGAHSLGNFLNEQGFAAVPSPEDPGPAGRKYFTGGYNTRTHGSVREGTIDAIQVENPRDFRSEAGRKPFAEALSHALLQFLQEHYKFHLAANEPAPVKNDPPGNAAAGSLYGCMPLHLIGAVVLTVYRLV